MCRATTCRSCGKTTWAGCGNHVAAVKASVPKGQWCTCSTAAKTASTSGGSWLSRLFGR
ncbi:hypothetical protein BN1051_00314 [Arthrobacter saudimassiliensis]|uniref:Uncharacterized protein n=1 Tax=Arthrobacter saudimassiliensis TaxID=1461584 RepID=A0A078ML41_9MICC|nr:hypothetical protein BN1051_00314 [Arthrobacter saudimassiliensis]